MKLDCKMEASGIEEIVLFRTLLFCARGYDWEKFVFEDDDELLATDVYLTDEQMMKKVKDLAKRKNTHVWVSGYTLNIDWRK